MTKMTSVLSASLVTLLLITPLTTAIGAAFVKNESPVPLYYRCVRFQDTHEHGRIAPGRTKKFPYSDHVSVKMDLKPVTLDAKIIYQFEFNVEPSDPDEVWYNLSAVDGQPMSQYARSLVPTDPKCDSAKCAAGDTSNRCQFTEWNNGKPRPCGVDASIQFTLGGN